MSTLTNALFIIAITWFSMASSEDPVDNSTTTTTTLTTTSTSATTTTQVTTLIPPTGTPKTPADVPPTNHYVLTDKNDNNSCIVMNVGIRLTFNYVTKDGKKVKDFPVDVPEKPTVGGFCKGDQINDQRIELKFFKDFNLSLTMTMNTTAKKYFLSNVYFTFKYNNDQFPDVKPEVEADVNETVNFFQTAEDRNFVCVSSQNLFQRNNSIAHGLTSITTYSLSLQAFRNDTSDKFTGHTTHCPNDEVSQLVPIIVGACLAGLIVIVLIAYLIGRKRSRAGYESV